MRLRLFLSFGLIALISVIGVVIIARQNTASAVRSFMYRGGLTGEGGLVQQLEAFYQQNGSWLGAQGLLQASGHGRGQGNAASGGNMGAGNQRLRVADSAGQFVADSSMATPSGKLTVTEKENAILLEVDDRTVGYLLAEGGSGFSQRDELFLLNRLTNAGLTAGLIAGGISLLLSLLLAYNLMRPVRELTQAAQHLGQGDLSQRVNIKGGDELTMLANTFNNMADFLQQAEVTRRSMTADIAHELRNPLAVQRANLEALQDGVYPFTPQALQPILEQNLLLTRLVDDLRTLALVDAGELKLECSAVDLPGLVERLVERFRPQAAQNQITLVVASTIASSSPRTVFVDPFRMDQILNNLLSNALRYTPTGGQIDIAIDSDGRQIRVSVHDSGPGIPLDALAHVFERFYRADRSRSRSEGGTGLGLAIARKLAEAQAGSLSAENHPRSGAIFTLQLPISADISTLAQNSGTGS